MREQRDDAEVLRFLERFALDMTQAGMPRMPARVFIGLVISESGQRTAPELAELLQVSPAAVSGAVRYLEQVGLIDRVREPGERRDRYQIFDDLWFEAIMRRDKLLERWEARLGEGAELFGPGTATGARLEEMREFMAFLMKEMPLLMERWRASRGPGGASA